MRCRVCGHEIDPQKSYCDKCGTPVRNTSKASNGEFSWNTIDFPKPKAVQDIEMNWGSMNAAPTQTVQMGRVNPVPVQPQRSPQPQVVRQDIHVQPTPVQPAQQNFRPEQLQQIANMGNPIMGGINTQMPNVSYTIPQQMNWTVPQGVWSMPHQQQVYIPQPYNVQHQEIDTAAPTISAMPQMPQGQMMQQMPTQVQPVPQSVQPSVQQQMANTMSAISQPIQMPQQIYVPQMYMTQPLPVQQIQQAQQPQMSWTMPQNAWTIQPAPQVMPQPAATISSAPAPVNPVLDMDDWLDNELGTDNTSSPANITASSGTSVMPESFEPEEEALDARADFINSAAARAHADWENDNAGSKTDKDQFFTFYKKNEDFQKLLDDEYQRYKNKYDTNAENLMKSQVIQASEIRSAAAKAEAKADNEYNLTRNTQSVNTSKVKEAVKRDRQTRPDVPDFDSAQKASANTVIFNAAKFAEESKASENLLKQKSSSVSTDNQGNVFDDEPETEFDKMIKDGTTSPEDIGESTLAISNAQLRKEIDDLAQKIEEADLNKPVHAYDKNKRQQDLKDMASARENFFSQEEQENKEKIDVRQMDSIFDQWDQERKDKAAGKKKKKHIFGKILLILLLVIVVFGLADVLCIKFLPSNEITDFFGKANTQLVEWYTQLTGKEVEIEQTTPMTAQELAASKVNKNIQQLSFDKAVSKFDSTKTYKFEGLSDAAIVTDDATINAVTTVVVGYNSSWVDYVNEGHDITCFDYLKTDGSMFRLASQYDRIGKTEEFKKLNIGEIRMDSQYVYVFTDELINVSSDGTTSAAADNPVYKLMLVGDEYKIVECD